MLLGWPEKRDLLTYTYLKCFWNYELDLTLKEKLFWKAIDVRSYSFTERVLRKIHSGHLGIETAKYFAKKAVFWPNMLSEIEDTVKTVTYVIN